MGMINYIDLIRINNVNAPEFVTVLKVKVPVASVQVTSITLVLVEPILGCAQNATTGAPACNTHVSEVEPPVNGTIKSSTDPNDSFVIVPTDVPVRAAMSLSFQF
jgi:hypothetical protein